jgi:hypothetical protein
VGRCNALRLAPAPVLVLAALAAAGCGSSGSLRQVDVSNWPTAQNEVALAVDPSDPRVLVAGSNEMTEETMLSYTSTDGGASWKTAAAPTTRRGSSFCVAGDPGVAIDRDGREYYSFLVTRCSGSSGWVIVATRQGPHGPWHVPARPVSEHSRRVADDRPSLAADTFPESRFRGRVYLVWDRTLAETREVLLAASGDGGRTWSRPTRVSVSASSPGNAAVAVARTGDVYVTWVDSGRQRILLSRSTDGGSTFGKPRYVAGVVVYPSHCYPQLRPVAEPKRCAASDPIVTVDNSRSPHAGRVYVTYSGGGDNGGLDVFVSAFDAKLRPLFGTPLTRQSPPQVNPPDGKLPSDEFFPAAATDSKTGALSVCFYGTGTGAARRTATYRCSVTTDGGATFSRPLAVASTPSDETVAGADDLEYGDYEAVASVPGAIHPAWTDSRQLAEQSEEIYTTRVTLDRLGAEKRHPVASADPPAGLGGPAYTAFVTRGNRACSAYYAAIAGESFDTKRAAVASLREELSAFGVALVKLRKLRPPPGRSLLYAHFLRQAMRANDAVREVLGAVRRNGVSAFDSRFSEMQDVTASVNATAGRLGLFVCAEPG